MATTADVKVTPGSGANVATYSITEDTETKQLQRVALSDSTGAEVMGLRTDAAATQTDATSLSHMNVLKQISLSIQAAAASLASPVLVQPYNYTPLTPGQYGLTCATATTLTIPSGALQVVVSVEGNSVRYTYDGTTTPTATVGQLLTSGQSIQFSGATILANLKFIQTAATATLNVEYTK